MAANASDFSGLGGGSNATYQGGGAGGGGKKGGGGGGGAPDFASMFGGGKAAAQGPAGTAEFGKGREMDIWHSGTTDNLFQIVSQKIEKVSTRVKGSW